MADKFAAFLLQLVVNDERRTAFENMSDADKKTAMSKFGLTQKEAQAILDGDLATILDLLNQQFGPKPGDFMGPPW
jgi:hypothetical protein